MKTNDLKELALARPDLEITPIVSEDAGCGDYSWTVASISRCSIEKVASSSINDEKFLIYDDDLDNFVDDYFAHYDDIGLSDDEIEQKAREEYENLPWEETILIYVDAY